GREPGRRRLHRRPAGDRDRRPSHRSGTAGGDEPPGPAGRTTPCGRRGGQPRRGARPPEVRPAREAGPEGRPAREAGPGKRPSVSDSLAFDLTAPRRIHLIGIGGAGMSAIATVLSAMGHTVTGSDLRASLTLDRLGVAGVHVSIGHRAENLGDADAVAVSTAVPRSNPEVAAARQRGIPVLSRAEILAAVVKTRRTVAVAGTHGKTTSCSMLALVMVEAGLRPSFIVGGELNEIGTGAVWDDGEWLAVEADESDGTFLHITPEMVLVTNV